MSRFIWKEAIYRRGTVKILPCELRDHLDQSWDYFRRKDLHGLSAVDATSFAIMRRAFSSLWLSITTSP